MSSRRKRGADSLYMPVPVLSPDGAAPAQGPFAETQPPSERAFVEATARLTAFSSAAAADGGAGPGRRRRSSRDPVVPAEAGSAAGPAPSAGNAPPSIPPTPTPVVLQEIDVVALEVSPPAGGRTRRRGTGGQQAASESSPSSGATAPLPAVEPAQPLEQMKENAAQVAREVDDVRGEARELRQEIGDLSDLGVRVDALRSEVREAEERLQRLSERREIERVAEELQIVAGQATTLRQHVDEAEQALASLRQQAERTDTHADEQSANLLGLRQQTEALVNEIAGAGLRLRESFQELEKALLARCDPMEERLTKLDADASEGWRLLQTLREEIEATRLQVRNQDEELRAGAALIQELRGQIREAEELLEAVRREYWAAKELPRPGVPVAPPSLPVAVQVEEPSSTPAGSLASGTPPTPASDRVGSADGQALGVTVNHEGQVVEVLPGSPAERAGLVLDDRITAVNGEPVTNGESLREAVQRAEVGSELALRVQRDTATIELKARVQPQPTAEITVR